MSPAPVPSLDELAADPGRAAGLPAEARQALTLRLAGLLIALAAPPNGQGADRPAPEPDRLLTPEEAGAILGVTRRWLYRHARTLPFTRRLSRKALRFSEAGLRRWQATRRA